MQECSHSTSPTPDHPNELFDTTSAEVPRGHRVHDNPFDAWLDSIAYGIGFYREPCEAMRYRDPVAK